MTEKEIRTVLGATIGGIVQLETDDAKILAAARVTFDALPETIKQLRGFLQMVDVVEKGRNDMKKKTKVERRMLKIPPGARPSSRVNMERSRFRVALIEAFTAGKFSTVKAAPRAKKRRTA